MCGICGELRLDGAPADLAAIQRMMAQLARRGPDHGGSYSDGALGFGHRRLAIIDLSVRSNQPMVDAGTGPRPGLQRDHLQLSRAAPGTAGPGLPLLLRRRHRGHPQGLARLGRGLRRAAARHVRLRPLGRRASGCCSWPATASASSRSTGPGDGRRLPLRLHHPGPAGGGRRGHRHRPGGAASPLYPARRGAGPADHPHRGAQAGPGPLAAIDADGSATRAALLAPGRAPARTPPQHRGEWLDGHPRAPAPGGAEAQRGGRRAGGGAALRRAGLQPAGGPAGGGGVRTCGPSRSASRTPRRRRAASSNTRTRWWRATAPATTSSSSPTTRSCGACRRRWTPWPSPCSARTRWPSTCWPSRSHARSRWSSPARGRTRSSAAISGIRASQAERRAPAWSASPSTISTATTTSILRLVGAGLRRAGPHRRLIAGLLDEPGADELLDAVLRLDVTTLIVETRSSGWTT